jgi:nitrate/nitrite transport system substrate-binding protein
MVANMKIGKMDGFCVGEPWNARAIADKIGFTSVTTQDMWLDHPEKVCAFTAEFADPQSQDRQGCAQGRCTKRASGSTTSPIVPNSAKSWRAQLHQHCTKETLLPDCSASSTTATVAPGRTITRCTSASATAITRRRNTELWWLSQFRRWGMVTGAPDYAGITRKVFRGDLYESAMKEIGFAHGGPRRQALHPV